MKTSEIIDALAERIEVTSAAAGKLLKVLLDIITMELERGEPVVLFGFGTFVAVMRAAREGRNPKTGEKINIPSIMTPKFKPSSSLKAVVAGEKSVTKKAVAKKPMTKKAAATKQVSRKPATKK